MKLKFSISQTTRLDPQIINGLILLKLKDEKYTVSDVTRNSVKFYDNPWKLVWKEIKRLDGGKFEINPIDNSVLVSFNYYLSLILPIIILIIVSTILIIQGQYYAPLFFLSFYTMVLVFYAMILKGVATEMLTEILNNAIPGM